MNNREKLLGVLVLAVLVGLGAKSVHSRLDDAYRNYSAQEKTKEGELLDAKHETLKGTQAADRLNEWRERSLPSQHLPAQQKYEYWLTDLLDSAGLNVEITSVDRKPPTPADKFTLLTYTGTGEGTVEGLTEFLYNFYRAKHLHKIASLHLTPTNENGDKLKIDTMKIEAYSLEDADRTETLAEGEMDRLALDSLDAYRKTIDDRNIFAVYTPPKPPPRVPDGGRPSRVGPPPFDHAKLAIATAIVETNGKPQVWINVQTTGKLEYLFPGESFKINDLTVKIIDVGTRTVTFEADGDQYTVKLGKSLRDGTPIDPEHAT